MMTMTTTPNDDTDNDDDKDDDNGNNDTGNWRLVQAIIVILFRDDTIEQETRKEIT